MKKLTQKGLSVLAALLTVMSLAALAVTMAYTVSGGYLAQANHISSTKAFFITQAGIEYGVKKIIEDVAGNSETFNFAGGSVNNTYNGTTLTTTGTIADATRIHRVDNPPQANCLYIDVDNVHLNQADERLMQITFRKHCLAQITIDRMQFTWTPDDGEMLKEIKIENVVAYQDATGVPSGTDIDIIDQVLVQNNNNVINWMEFSDGIGGKQFDLLWTLSDGSTRTSTFQTE